MTSLFSPGERPGLYCVELRTNRWAEAVEWYRTVLGLRVLVRVVDDGYALIEAGETRLALCPARSRETPRGGSVWPSRSITCSCKHCGSRLEERGTPLVATQHHPEDLREINLADPDGNRIRLFCWPKGS